VHLLLGSVACLKTLWWLVRFILRRPAARQTRLLRRRMTSADTYEEWSEAACELDVLGGRTPPAAIAAGIAGLQKRTRHLQQLRQQDDVHGLMWDLRQDGSRNVGALLGLAAEEEHVHCLIPPPAMNDYISEMHKALQYVCHHTELSLEERIAFLRELRHAYGRTGLVLSGGGSFGHFHCKLFRFFLFFFNW